MIGALSSQIYAKEGADDSSSGSSNDSSGRESEDRGRESENEQRGQEPEAERGGATEVRGQEFEAERGGALEVRGQEFEAERGGANEIRGEVEIGGITFEIRGTIASVSNNTLTVMGRTITTDPARVVNFQQTAPVAIGQSVKIEGSISNGTFLAREIKPLGEADNSGSGSNNSGPGRNRSISENEKEHGIEIESESNAFEARGKIESVSGNTFIVFGQEITIDPARVVNFQKTADVKEGQSVKIEGVIDNGIFLAREIKPLDGKDKNGSADDNAGSESSRKENRGLVASIGSIFGSIISSMINLFR